MRSSSSARAASNARRAPASTGSGIDQCSQSFGGSSCSWARSHTVTPMSASRSPASSARGWVPARSNPARFAAAAAQGCTRVAGRDPALAARSPVRSRHSAAASGERAEFRVQTNNARPVRGGTPPTPMSITPRWRRRAYRRRRSPADTTRSMSPTSSRTWRWWASRLPARPKRAARSDGARSDDDSSSTIARRSGSPRAACTAARRSISVCTHQIIDQRSLNQSTLIHERSNWPAPTTPQGPEPQTPGGRRRSGRPAAPPGRSPWRRQHHLPW
jgi:hypothetical protein